MFKVSGAILLDGENLVLQLRDNKPKIRYPGVFDKNKY